MVRGPPSLSKEREQLSWPSVLFSLTGHLLSISYVPGLAPGAGDSIVTNTQGATLQRGNQVTRWVPRSVAGAVTAYTQSYETAKEEAPLPRKLEMASQRR